MSVREREEERQKSCPSRGLGLAAAAIGVGVGAALYYFFNKRAEHPDTDGATTSGWTCEEALSKHHRCNDSSSSSDSDDEYSTISEHTTTDTSVNEEQTDDDDDDDGSFNTISSEESSNTDHLEYTLASNLSNDPSETDTSIDSLESPSHSDTELDQDWDVTDSSLDVPRTSFRDRTPSPLRRFVMSLNYLVSPRNQRQRVPEDNQMRASREIHFRQRSWSLEECSICCEVMLKDQPLRQLACSHNFHAACVEPWLEEHTTCPNCRKLAGMSTVGHRK